MGKRSLFVAISVCTALAAATFVPSAATKFASYHDYDSSGHGYDLMAVSAYCSTWDANKDLSWRSKHPWTAYYKANEHNCGRCLRVTNPETHVSVTVRIVDHCSNGGLDLEQKAFNALDTNGAGYARGHLNVKFAFVSC